jgi:hypothetical protein
MVSAGWAWAYTKYSLDYLPREAWSAINGRGVHAHVGITIRRPASVRLTECAPPETMSQSLSVA